MTRYALALLVATILCLVAAPRSAAAAPKWQYKVLTLEHLEKLVEKDKGGKKLKEKLQKEKASAQDRFAQLVEFALNQLGEDGWELVSVKLVGDRGEAILFFKRPR
jgi:hypothetical protein